MIKKREERQVRREEKRKILKAQRVKPSTPSRATDALIGDEEHNGKRKKEQKERNRERAPNPITLDHLAASYDSHGSYVDPIPK